MWRFSVGGALKSMFLGGVSGAITFGIGEMFKAGGTIAKAVGDAKFLVQGAAHGVAQGALSMMQGGKFWSGATAGFLGHLGGAAWSNTVGNSNIGAIGFGALSGGVGAELTGGNFWQGAVTGGIVAGLNGVMHKMQEDPLKKHAGEVKHTLEEWEARYHDSSWGEIATEAGWKQGQPLGPHKDWRYIKAPDGKIMDMRHVSIVGYRYGETAGNAIEHIQFALGQTGSAYDPQDYYSNKVGAMFSQLRSMGSWSSNSWSYDFKRFIDTQYSTLFKTYKP